MLNERAIRSKLTKARAFLDFGDLALDDTAQADSCVSLAASAAVNAADAVLLLHGVPLMHARSHTEAILKLRSAGYRQEASHLEKALLNKTRAQYSEFRCTVVDSRRALQHAGRLLLSAESLAAARGVLHD